MLVRRYMLDLAAAMAVMMLGADPVAGQDYPTKPIRLVTGLPGGGGDSVARIIAQGTTGPLGQPVIVDNRTTVQSSEAVAKAPPDGYTLLVIGSSVWILPLSQKMPYDMSDFSPVTLISRGINVVAVHPSVPIKSVKDLIGLAKARPGQLNYGSTGVGGPQQLAIESFKSTAGIDIVHVPYKGNAQALTALLSGEVQMMITDSRLLAPHVKAGRLRALAVTSAEPSALAPGLPTVSASGLPGYEALGSMTVMFAPAKTPAAIINRLNQEVARFLNRPEVKARFLNDGEEIVGNTPEQFAAIIKADTARTAKAMKDAGIKLD